MRSDPYIIISDICVVCENDNCNSNLENEEFYTYARRFSDSIHTINSNTKIRDILDDDSEDSYDFCVQCFNLNNFLERKSESTEPCLFCMRIGDCCEYISIAEDEPNDEKLVFCTRCYNNGDWRKIFIKVIMRNLHSDDRFNGRLPTVQKMIEIKRVEHVKELKNLTCEHNPFY